MFPASFGIVGGSCYYLSTPMTTGKEFQRILRMEVLDEARAKQIRAEVLQRNLDRVAPIAASLRCTLTAPLIDPTAFSVEGWTQPDYHAFLQSSESGATR